MTAAGQPAAAGERAWWNFRSPYWLIRMGGFAAVAALTLARSGSGHRQFVITVLAVSGVLIALWGVLDWHDRQQNPSPGWPRAAMLGALAAVGGTAAALSPARAVDAFAVMAAIAAGNDLASGPAVAVTAIGVLGVEAGGLIFGFSTSAAVGLPLVLVLVVSLLAGRDRRDARIRTAQAAALVSRTRQAQSEQRRAAALEERSRIAREISLADDGLGETRRAIHALRADTPPLPGGLACLAGSHEQHYQHPVALSVTGHLDYAPGHVTLTISNLARPSVPGVAADRSEDGSGGGCGLAGMRERLQLTGGTLTAGRAGGQWIVRAQVPL